MPRSCEVAHEDSKVEAQRGERFITQLLITDPWSKGDYSRHIREASMAMDGLPEGVPPPGRVPGQLLQVAPILKRRRRWYKGEFIEKRITLGVSIPRAKYRRRGCRGDPPGSQEASWRGLGWGRAKDPPGLLVVAPLRCLGYFGSFRVADFLSDFSGFFGALLMAGKYEIQKQQKTTTGSWVHWVNRLVQICSKVYESSSKSWQSHTKHA